jgi:hypothetical protein
MADTRAQELWEQFFEQGRKGIAESGEWHWFAYHFTRKAQHVMACGIVDACVDCELASPGLGMQFMNDLSSVCGKEKYHPHYEQLLQKMAEILVLRQLVTLKWPEGTRFDQEPEAKPKGKRPELRVTTPDRTFLFEVKTPSLLAHIRARNANGLQVAGRVFKKEELERFEHLGTLTKPRDNPIVDFLADAESKFSQFKETGPHTSVLVIVWDDNIYEPITVLTHEQCGLLTPNSFNRDDEGRPVSYPSIDAVVVVRHLTYLYRATKELPLLDRRHALDFGAHGALPNIIIPLADPALIPDLVREGLRALPLDHHTVQHAADYRPKDLVLWF